MKYSLKFIFIYLLTSPLLLLANNNSYKEIENDLYFYNSYIFDYDYDRTISIAVLDETHFVIAYLDNSDVPLGKYRIGTILDSTISFSSEYNVGSSEINDILVYRVDNKRFIIAYTDVILGNENANAMILTIDDPNLGGFDNFDVGGPNTINIQSIINLDLQHCIIFYNKDTDEGKAVVGTINNLDISFETPVIFHNGAIGTISATELDQSRFAVVYVDYDNYKYGTFQIGTFSNLSLSFGDEQIFSDPICNCKITTMDNNHCVIAYALENQDNGSCFTKIASITDMEAIFSSAFLFSDSPFTGSDYLDITNLTDKNFIVTYSNNDNDKNTGIVKEGIINGNLITFGSTNIFNEHYSTNDLTIDKINDYYFITAWWDGENKFGESIIGYTPDAPEVIFNSGASDSLFFQQNSFSIPQMNWPFGQFSLSSTSNGAILNSISIKINGNYDPNDLFDTPYQLFVSDINDFSTATALGEAIEDPGVGQTLNFTSLNDTLFEGTKYYWVTADISFYANGSEEFYGEVSGPNELAITLGNLSTTSKYGVLDVGHSPSSIYTNENKILSFYLENNFPNPFNPTTTIKYDVPKTSQIIINIYNTLGQKIRTLIDKKQSPGRYSIIWNGKDDFERNVASGIYLYQLKTKDFVKTKKMILIR